MKHVIACAILLLGAVPAFADSVPSPVQGLLDIQGRTQLVVTVGPFDVLAELLGRFEGPDEGLGYRSVTLGGYWRPIPNLKVGAFYRLQAGARHDDDWVSDGSGDWLWQDATSRPESVLMLDASPRFQLAFLPGETWVLMLKARWLYNTFNGEQSLLAWPQLTWFWLSGGAPFLDVMASYEVYFPLSFGSTPVYESYPYVTVLWHVTPELGIELGGAYRTTIWSTSASERAVVGTTYAVTESRWVVSAGVVLVLGQ
ncbi:MAG TPA: hypothetical protein VHE79_14070 [Spirochaetia bacterium]